MPDIEENIFADPHRLEGDARTHRFDMLLRSPRTAVMVASLPPGETASRREATDSRADRVVYLIEGEAQGSVDGREQSLDAGQLLMIPAGRSFQLTNTGSTRFLYLDFISKETTKETTEKREGLM